ncbi:MAG: ribosome assembly cofactor RimP [Flavobacteriaceae bacterium]
MLKGRVKELLDGALKEDESLFLIDFSITAGNKIKIVLDGDQGVLVQDCMRVSRAIEHNLDREEEDFSLEVASAGAASPMILPRQFKKNIGRKIQVDILDDSFEGNLTSVTDEVIVIEWKAREPKPIGKGKVTVQKRKEIDFSDIREAKVVLKF